MYSRRSNKAWAVVALALAGASTTPALADNRADYWRYVTEAVRAVAAGKYVSAVHRAGRARAARATPELDALVGLAALAGGKPRLAKKQLDSAITRKTSEPRVFYWAARTELVLGNRASAARRLEQALAIGSHLPAVQFAVAIAGHRANRRAALEAVARERANLLDPSLYPTPAEGAVELLEPLLRGFPRPLSVWRTQGLLYWRLEAVLPAYERFSQVLAKRKNDAVALAMSARCLLVLGAADEALPLARRAVAREPTLAMARAALGETLLAKGKARLAAIELERAANRAPRDAAILLSAARACAKSENTKCAQRFYKYALRRDPSLAAAHFGIALLAQQTGRSRRARLAFDRAIALAPARPGYFEAAAQAAAMQKQTARARALLVAARRARRVSTRIARRQARVAELLRRLGRALHRCGCQRWLGRQCKQATTPGCASAVKRVVEPARGLLVAHIALRQGRRSAALRALRTISGALRVRSLFIRNPRVFSVSGTTATVSGKTVSRARYTVRKVFPIAIIGRLPAARRKKPSK